MNSREQVMQVCGCEADGTGSLRWRSFGDCLEQVAQVWGPPG